MRPILALIVALSVLAVACGGGGSSTASLSATSAPTPALTAPATAAPTPNPSPALASANAVLNALKLAGLPIAEVDDYTAATDPNNLLGRPHGYSSKVNFHDSRYALDNSGGNIETTSGGSIEFFPNADDAASRYSYVSAVARGILTEYDYLSGTAVLRLSNRLTPDQAAEYLAAFKAAVP